VFGQWLKRRSRCAERPLSQPAGVINRPISQSVGRAMPKIADVFRRHKNALVRTPPTWHTVPRGGLLPVNLHCYATILDFAHFGAQ